MLALKLRLYPTPQQEELFNKSVGCCRVIYNTRIAFKLREYERLKKHLGKGLEKSDFKWRTPPTEKDLKKKLPWLADVNAQSLVEARECAERAFKNYHTGKYAKPRFKKKGAKDSFTSYQGTSVDIENRTIRLPKIGTVSFRGSTHLKFTRLRKITVSRSSDKWFASVLVEIPDSEYFKESQLIGESIGIDLGVKIPVATSTKKALGRRTKVSLHSLEKRRKRFQRKLARQKKGSNNRAKTKLKIARAYEKERCVRNNFIEQLSCRLARGYESIVFEDLSLSRMTKSAKGTKQNPGKSVRAKSGLNRELLRMGLGRLIIRTTQKADRFGTHVILVDPRNTSRTCSDCGVVDKQSRRSQSKFRCVHCGFKLNADFNAARVIESRGLH